MARKDDKLKREPSKTYSQVGPPLSTNETGSISSSTAGKHKEREKSSSSSQTKGSSGKDRLLSKMAKITDWITTSEPSANALKQHKKEAFQKAGVSLNDAEASAKLHAPIGGIPSDAIRSNAGPSPEEVVARKKAEQRRRQLKQEQERQQEQQRVGKQRAGSASGSASFSCGSSYTQTPSLSGYSSSMSGPGGSMFFVSGDDDFGANGWGPR